MASGKNSVVGIALAVILAKTLEHLFKGLRRLLHRWRRAFTPVWFACGVWFVAVIWSWHWRDWWPLALSLPAVGITLALLGPRLSRGLQWVALRLVPEGLDRGTNGVLDRPVERIYLAALTSTTGGWLALRVGDGPSGASDMIWKVALVLFGGTWWWHRRIRVAGRADRYARKWGKLAEGKTGAMELKCLIGSKVVGAFGFGGSARLHVKLAPGATFTSVSRAVAALASFYKLRPGAISAKEDERSANHVWFTILAKDPWKTKLVHPMPEPGSRTLVSCRGRFEMGIHADNEVSIFRLQHTLLVGQSGSGKSAWLESLMIWLLAFQDVIIVGIDMAGGATLGMWRKVLALPLATDVSSAIETLERVLAFIQAREIQLGVDKDDDSDSDSFQPTPETPWLVFIIDEYPDLVTEGASPATKLASRIAKRARKAGVKLIWATQNGSKADMGDKETQGQFTALIGLRLEGHPSKVLWGDLTRTGWSSVNLGVGQYLQRDNEHTTPEPAKGFFVTPKERRAVIDVARKVRPQAEPAAWEALTGQTALMSEPGIVSTATSDPVLAVLQQEPMKVEQLCLVAKMSRATVYRRLAALKDAGQAHSINGVWYPGPVIEGTVESVA